MLRVRASCAAFAREKRGIYKMFPSTHPKQYQDVKANLQWYTTIISALVGLLFYSFVLPDGHRQSLNTIFEQIPSSKIVGSGVIMVLFGFLGWVLIFGFEIHDKVYDHYFTRWRFYYDLDFILPTLFRPLTHKLDKRFFKVAQNNRYEFMKPFYHFVADYEHEHKVKENLIVRFYEAVTKYWITQINEILLFLLLLLTFMYWRVYNSFDLPLNTIIVTNFVIVVLFLINRWFVRSTREAVRLATIDEIEDIHLSFLKELEQDLRRIHEEFNLRYEDD
jgi:hypothetical protein